MLSSRQNYILPNFLSDLPWGLILCIIALITIGCSLLYSTAGGNMEPWAMRQMIKFLTFFPMLFIIAAIPLTLWLRMSYVIYVGGVVLLLMVYFFGTEGGLGAQRWLNIAGFQFQPSELMKVGLVLGLARYYQGVHGHDVRRIVTLFIPAALIAIPFALIIMQPNLGTAGILGMVGAIILLAAGANWRLYALGLIILAVAIPVGWEYVLHDYQKQRVLTFLDPERDPMGAGYNIIQSKIAIGSGGMLGKGFTQGTQSQLSFVPEQETDFIFTIFAEEFGFIGSLMLLAIYLLMLTYIMLIALFSQNTYGRLVAIGMGSILFLHVFINLGMVMGILPVVGVPLPLLSYGGSSLLSTMIALAFVMNAHSYRHKKII